MVTFFATEDKKTVGFLVNKELARNIEHFFSVSEQVERLIIILNI